MDIRVSKRKIVIALVLAGLAAPTAMAQVEGAPKPSVPEIYTMEGQFARIAYNNEGWVTLGYRTANDSQGDEWMLLEAGVTVLEKDQELTREDFAVKLPDGSVVPMATQSEYADAGRLPALNRKANVVRDSINYFPPSANRACAMRFFSDPAQRGQSLPYDQFSVNPQMACLGRLFFKLPDGQTIEPGQYWLRVSFENSVVEAPFRILTKEEEKYLSKNWKDLKKQHEAYLTSQMEKAKK